MGVHVLVVDDSTTIQKVIRIAFSRLDVSITTAASLIEALSEIHSRRPDVILADASLNGVRSVQDFAKLSAESGKAPVILLVGSYDSVDETALRQAGFPHIIRKPFESSDIIRRVGEVLGRDLENPSAPIQSPYVDMTPQSMTNDPSRISSHTTIMTGNPRDTHILPPPPAGFVAQTMVGLTEQTMSDAARGAYIDQPVAQTLPQLPSYDSLPLTQQSPKTVQPTSAYSDQDQDDDVAMALDDATASLFPSAISGHTSHPLSDPRAPLSSHGQPISGHTPDNLLSDKRGKKAFEAPESTKKRMFQPLPPPPAEETQDREPLLQAEVVKARMMEETRKELEAPLRTVMDHAVLERAKDNPVHGSAEGMPAVSYRPTIDEIRIIIDSELRTLIQAQIRESVEEYCAKQFAQLARDIITSEIRRLTDERSRLLVDN